MREFGEIDTPKEEFAVDWAEMDHANDVRLAVEPDGRIVGYANCTGEGQFSGIDAEGYVHADHEGRGIGTALIRWTEQRAADFVALAPEGTRVMLQNPTNAYNTEAAALMARTWDTALRDSSGACRSSSLVLPRLATCQSESASGLPAMRPTSASSGRRPKQHLPTIGDTGRARSSNGAKRRNSTIMILDSGGWHSPVSNLWAL